MQQTSNYSLPTYQGTDSPNLITGYNSAMSKIDTQMKSNADAASAASTAAATASTAAQAADEKAVAAQTTADTANGKADTNATNITSLTTRVSALEDGSFVPSANDADFDVTKLSGAKVTANGIVYFPQSS